MQRLMKERKSMENQEDEDTYHLDYINNQIEETQRSLCDLTGMLFTTTWLKFWFLKFFLDDDNLINASELGLGDLRYIVTQLLPYFINSQR